MSTKHNDLSCTYLANHSKFDCKEHADPYECPDVIIVKTSLGYGIPIHDGGASFISINYCPWCGIKLD